MCMPRSAQARAAPFSVSASAIPAHIASPAPVA